MSVHPATLAEQRRAAAAKRRADWPDPHRSLAEARTAPAVSRSRRLPPVLHANACSLHIRCRLSLGRTPAPDAFRAAHNFRRTIEIPGFHVTSWFDIFQTSVLAAFNHIQSRAGNQKLWIGPNEHYFVYHRNFWPRDPYFAWFDYWLKGEPTGIMDEPAVFYSPRAWVEDRDDYTPADWLYAERWPPPASRPWSGSGL